jgi:octaprenyl-diphosphate synthase
MTWDEIRDSIEPELNKFEDKFRDSVKTGTPILNAIMRYIIRSKGKQMRPMFVFLSASMFGEVKEATYRGAALIELLHTATLVHDDVVDEAETRRGFFSINALWKNKIAVLVGDYLLSKGLLLSVENNDFDLLKIVSNAVREMSEGELLQIEKTRKLNISEENYFEIIQKKTATLIASACAVGAKSAGATDEEVERMRVFGEKTGIAFQIKDDLLDFSLFDTGKPRGADLKEKKLTLPVIYSLQQSSFFERQKFVHVIENKKLNGKRLHEAFCFIRDKGGMHYAEEKMIAFQREAEKTLLTFPENNARASLLALSQFTTSRNK